MASFSLLHPISGASLDTCQGACLTHVTHFTGRLKLWASKPGSNVRGKKKNVFRKNKMPRENTEEDTTRK